MVKINVNNLMKSPSPVSKYLCAINLCDDVDIKACIE